MPVRPEGSQACATSTRSPPMIWQPSEHPDDLDQLGHSQPAGLRRARPGRLRRVEHVDVDRDVEGMPSELRQQPADDLHRVAGHHGVHRKEVGPVAVVLLAGARANPDLIDALRRNDVHHPGEGRGVVVPLAEELLAQVRMRVEMEDAKVGKRRPEHLDHGHGGRVVAAQHERDEPRTPPGGDLLARGIELLAGRRPVGKLAVADVGDRQIFEVALERGRVRLDRLGAEPDVERARVGALAEVHSPFEGNAVDDDLGVSERKTAADECRRHRAHISSPL